MVNWRRGWKVFSPPYLEKDGKYTFIVTEFLPTWYADFDGKIAKERFTFKGYCSLDVN